MAATPDAPAPPLVTIPVLPRNENHPCLGNTRPASRQIALPAHTGIRIVDATAMVVAGRWNFTSRALPRHEFAHLYLAPRRPLEGAPALARGGGIIPRGRPQ